MSLSLRNKFKNKPGKFGATVLVVTVGVVWFGSFAFSQNQPGEQNSELATTAQEEALESDIEPITGTSSAQADVPEVQGDSSSQTQEQEDASGEEGEPGSEIEQPSLNPDAPFTNLNLEAQSAVVWDAGAERSLYEKNPNQQLPLASLTKVMTALVASQYLSSDDIITITEQDLEAYGSHGLYEGEQWKFADLRAFMLMESSNDAARALARTAQDEYNTTHEPESSVFAANEVSFTSLMNKMADDIGLENSYFLNSSGLDLNESYLAGSYGTASDMAKLMAYVVSEHQNMIAPTTNKTQSFTSVSGTIHTAANTNQVIDQLPNLIGSKTGYTVLAAGNLLVSIEGITEEPITIAVLGSSRNGRFSDTLTLYRASNLHYGEGQNDRSSDLAITEEEGGSVPVRE